MTIVLYFVAFVVYWTIGVIIIATIDRIASQGHNPLDPRKDSDAWAVTAMALLWPVGIIFLIALMFRESARWLLRKIQKVR